MKQIQYAILQLTEANPAEIRKHVEGPLNNGWELQDWKPVGITKDVNNMSAVSLVICLTRESESSPTYDNADLYANDEEITKKVTTKSKKNA